MAKLVEILARELKEWPEGAAALEQHANGVVTTTAGEYVGDFEIASDAFDAVVTMSCWEDIRSWLNLEDDMKNLARAALYMGPELGKVVKEYRTGGNAKDDAGRARIAANQQAAAEAREIARTGAMTTEEQELADIACGKRSREDQALWDKVASERFCELRALRFPVSAAISDAFNDADAFMAERAKRMKGGV